MCLCTPGSTIISYNFTLSPEPWRGFVMKRLQRKDGHSSLWCSAMGCFLYSQAASGDSGCIWELESQPQTVALPEPHIFTRSKCTQQCSGAWVERLWQQLCDYSKVLVVSLFHVSSPLVNKNIHLRVWVGKIDKYLWSTTVCLCECSKDCSMCLCVCTRCNMHMELPNIASNECK